MLQKSRIHELLRLICDFCGRDVGGSVAILLVIDEQCED